MMQLGPKGTKLIQSFEKLRYQAYQDPRGIWTCGWGHTGADVAEFTTCDDARAAEWFAQDTQTAVNAVIRSLDIAVSQNQFDALASFTFNVGQGSEAHSTLLKLVNAGRFALAADQFNLWNHVNGRVSDGLTARRAAERALFLDQTP
jgi:lysozyme